MESNGGGFEDSSVQWKIMKREMTHQDRESGPRDYSVGEGSGLRKVTRRKLPTADAIQDWLVSHVALELRVDYREIDLREPFANYGLNSTAAVGLSGELEEWLGLELSPTLLWDYPTIEILARQLFELQPASE